jgi:hypothetical protein
MRDLHYILSIEGDEEKFKTGMKEIRNEIKKKTGR